MRLERRQTESGGVCQMRNTNVIERATKSFSPAVSNLFFNQIWSQDSGKFGQYWEKSKPRKYIVSVLNSPCCDIVEKCPMT